MPLRIVYLDDEPRLCEVFEDNLGGMAGVKLQTFIDPQMAIECINSDPPDLIFLDYRLPKTNAVAIAQQIRCSSPIAIVSGDLIIDLKPPFVKYFEKPLNFDAIEAFIQGFMATKSAS